MVPAGYLVKRVAPPPGWLGRGGLVDVCSVSDCVNTNVVDVQKVWCYNGFGVANEPGLLWAMAALDEQAATEVTLFYYEAYEEEIESDGWTLDPGGWRALSEIAPCDVTNVVPPPPSLVVTPIGYDVVVFGDLLEHSPLSCNSIAETHPVNEHCLFDTLQAAKAAIETGVFGGGCEQGVYRIFSVSKVTSGPALEPAGETI